MAESPAPDYRIDEEHGHRRQRARQSGAFLVQDAAPRYTYETLRPLANRSSLDRKGKGKAGQDDLVNANRTPSKRHRNKLSIGNSPLSTVIYNSAERSGSPRGEGYDIEGTSSARSGAPDSIHDSRDGLRNSMEAPPSALGHDTDPAQIVSLALSLSESRRRNASGGRLSPLYGNANHRQGSLEQGATRLSGSYGSVGGATLRRHLNEQRRVSKNLTPTSSGPSTESPSPRSVRGADEAKTSTPSRYLDADISNQTIQNPSSATLARAEKARIAFELSYEYRRLLQHVPKLPAPNQSGSVTSKAAGGFEAMTWNDLGRVYNPLQYIRNRKVRGRERKHLDAEAEGWKDLDRVKLWIDAIASKHEASISSTPSQITIPPQDVAEVDFQATQTGSNYDKSAFTDTRSIKSERQDSDWKISPWDLLADAAWLSRNDNIRLIEDAKGSKLLPPKKQSKESTPRTSIENARGPLRRSLSLVRRGVDDERQSVELETPRKQVRSRGHFRGKSQDVKSLSNGNESPRGRKGRWHRTFGRSRSPSSSEDSTTNGMNGHAWGHRRDQDSLDGAALEKQMMKLLAQEFEEDPFSSIKRLEPAQEVPSESTKASPKEQHSSKSALQHSPNQVVAPEQGTPTAWSTRSPRPLKGKSAEERGRQPRSSIDDLDATAPNSPSTFQFGPSIFINRSAPNSRSVSPKKPLPQRFRPSLRSGSKSRRTMSEYRIDSVVQSPTKGKPLDSGRSGSEEDQQAIHESESASNLLSPVTAEHFGKRFRRMNDSSSSLKVVKESRDPESRFKGLLKGTRIAELVGNEVSRVGGMIWRRDASSLSRATSPVNGRSTEGSDTDGEMGTLANSPETDLSRVTTRTDEGVSNPRTLNRDGQPKYHPPALPTFRSSISRSTPDSPTATSPEDHPITRQQLAQKARGRSSKFERLAPPKIDMRNVSPSASPPLSRIQTKDTNNISRETSASQSDQRLRSADRRLNDVLGIPGTVRNGVGPTGLASLSSKTSKRPDMGDRQWSISDRSVSNTRTGIVTKRDIARVRALLLSSGIKANEIARQADSVEDPPSLPQLREIYQRSGNETRIPKVPRQQEHLLTAKLIVQEIDDTNQRLREAAERYSDKTVEGLHQQLRDLDAYVSHNLVPAVRGSADDADDLSTELTTTQTLAIKRLNDAVDLVLRRRRRRLRWVRRGGYALLEWMLLGIMWAVWMIVVAVRLIRGVIGGFLGFVRWMLWL
ncbi:MAG: hypothetical protein LQ337_006029 [Flavoplaca oasis]|nr:MAG: hypothetical protein LQ337_006029 [Flavoplaca oasis]